MAVRGGGKIDIEYYRDLLHEYVSMHGHKVTILVSSKMLIRIKLFGTKIIYFTLNCWNKLTEFTRLKTGLVKVSFEGIVYSTQ